MTNNQTNWQELCVQLYAALEAHSTTWDDEVLLDRVGTALRLAQPEPEEPTDEEILALSHEHEVSYTMCDGHVIYPKQEGCDMRDDVLSFTRAVLARGGK